MMLTAFSRIDLTLEHSPKIFGLLTSRSLAWSCHGYDTDFEKEVSVDDVVEFYACLSRCARLAMQMLDQQGEVPTEKLVLTAASTSTIMGHLRDVIGESQNE